MNSLFRRALFPVLLLLCLGLFNCASENPASHSQQNTNMQTARPAEPGQGDCSLEQALEQSAQKIAADLPQGSRVAIIAFESEYDNFSDYLMEELTDRLMDFKLTVADRSSLEYVKRELNFQMSGDVSDESAVSIGKMLGAQLVITGQMINTGEQYRYRINAVNVETAVRDSSSQFAVRNDQRLQKLIAALAANKTNTRSREY